MAIYELRTYQVTVGKMKDAVEAYSKKGLACFAKGRL
ncbi:NIPSNAP family protein [Alphaproteobacteria bacterium]|nr:NIPSNAP family protein [Alphaproteobacteria bacterium]